MTAETINRMTPRSAAACPWCGAGTALMPTGDGIGNMVLTCTACGCKGPPMPITGDFADADLAAVTRWSIRPAMPPRIGAEAVDRIRRCCAVQALLHGPDEIDASVPVRMGDLRQLLQAANVSLA